MSVADLVPQLLGPLGLVAGCLLAIWGFATERIVPGAALRREQALNEALLRRLDRALVVSRRAVDAVDKE